MKAKVIRIVLFLFIVSQSVFCNTLFNDNENEGIKKVVEVAYINGVFNDATTDAMLEGFHPKFTIQFLKGDSLVVNSLQQWRTSLDKWKSARKNWKNVVGKIHVLAIENEIAVVRVDVFQENKALYTDFLSLYHFSSGWKITNKIYTVHN